MKSLHTSSYYRPTLLLAMAVVVIAAKSLFAQVDVIALRTQLVEETGSSYLAARDVALSLPAADFADLLALLEVADPISQDRLVASILRTRRELSHMAAEFDERLDDSLNNPSLMTHSQSPKYRVWPLPAGFESDPLAFEVYLKLDVPQQLKSDLLGNFGSRSNPQNIDRFLCLTKATGVGVAGSLYEASKDTPSEQTRITPIVVDLYKYWRSRGQMDTGAYRLLESFGTQLQLDALNEIKAFEQELLATDGIDPAHEEAYNEDRHAKSMTLSAAKRKLRQAQIEAHIAGEPERTLETPTADVERLEQEVRAAEKRLSVVRMWKDLERTIVRLHETIAQDQPPPADGSELE